MTKNSKSFHKWNFIPVKNTARKGGRFLKLIFRQSFQRFRIARQRGHKDNYHLTPSQQQRQFHELQGYLLQTQSFKNYCAHQNIIFLSQWFPPHVFERLEFQILHGNAKYFQSLNISKKNNCKKLCANSNELTKMSSSIEPIRLMMFLRWWLNSLGSPYEMFDIVTGPLNSHHSGRSAGTEYFITRNGEYEMNQGCCYNFHKFLNDYQNRWECCFKLTPSRPATMPQIMMKALSHSHFRAPGFHAAKIISIYVKKNNIRIPTHTSTESPAKRNNGCVHLDL